MSSGALSRRLRDTADLLDTYAPTTDALRALQEAKNAIEVAQAQLVAEMVDQLDHETEGYSSPRAWLRGVLRLDTSAAGSLLAAGHTLRVLPELDDVSISLAHLRQFTYAVKHAGIEPTRGCLHELIHVAAVAEPADLHGIVRQLRDAVYPDALEQAWIKGMEREDVKLTPVGEGWHLTGFLNATTGAKLTTLLTSMSAPTGADDPRTTAQRRVDALETLLDGVLRSGLPEDQGIRPHLTITVDATDITSPAGTAHLLGFGTLPNTALQELICESDITPLMTHGPHAVLDVGHTRRLATKHQRKAVNARQHHTCAGPGCRSPIIHVHHIIYWSDGGPTDLNNLIGLCPRCHRAVHRGALVIDPDTRQFTTGTTPLARTG